MGSRPHIGVLYSRVRVEEKWIFAALEQRGADYERIDDRQAVFDLDHPQSWRQFDAVLERSISYSRGLYALQVLNAWGVPTVSVLLAARLVISYHLEHQRPMMGAFLDALGIAHEDGLIKDETPKTPDAATLDTGVRALAAAYPKADVARYFWALLWQDPETWGGLKGRPELALE